MIKETETFYKDKLTHIFTHSDRVIDIGGSLRISKERGNRFSKENEWLRTLADKVEYLILDPVDTYNPDIVGDIHDLPLKDSSEKAIICTSVLEHVENPIKAAQELYRVLKPGGMLFVYVPFLYYYHAEQGYYGDYWRFTEDSLRFMFKPFSTFEITHARGPIETLVKLTPVGRIRLFIKIGRLLDRVTGKTGSKQTSGFYVYLEK